MSEDQNLNALLIRLENLQKRQEEFSLEISALKSEIYRIKAAASESVQKAEAETVIVTEPNVEQVHEKPEVPAVEKEVQQVSYISKEQAQVGAKTVYGARPVAKPKTDIEKFIGENLINKIGIVITVIGVAIGAKYAVDHQLISPLTRIVLAYVFGLGLLGTAYKLKSKYENFSAVLLSGAMAILYFVSYLAYSMYALIPQFMAFILMLLFTGFTVFAAIRYNRQVIAHIGLVGAYALPFLLSDGSGKVGFLFSYMAIINIGILFIGFRKYWNALFKVAFVLTWMIFSFWYFTDFRQGEHLILGSVFAFIFFAIFYGTFLAYKFIRKESYAKEDVVFLLLNSVIYYSLGYAILGRNETGEQLQGVFTLFNAILHFVVCVKIYNDKLADRKLFQLVAGLVLLFVTLTFPVQLDGNWVTLFWIGEAVLLYYIGIKKDAPIYEKLSYPIMILAFFSLLQDWAIGYDAYYFEGEGSSMLPILNFMFFTSLCFIVGFGYIMYLNYREGHNSAVIQKGIYKWISKTIPYLLLIVAYFAGRNEISYYFSQLYQSSKLATDASESFGSTFWNNDLNGYRIIWIINYSLMFVSLLGVANLKYLKNRKWGVLNGVLLIFTLLVFMGEGLYVLSELRESYLDPMHPEYYSYSVFHILIRYVSFIFVAFAYLICRKYSKAEFMGAGLKIPYELLLAGGVLWLLSSELIHWMDIAGSSALYKLGLSIFWGIYSLVLIVIGLWRNKKHLRIAAIILFGLTLVKLFFYDIAHLHTIAKTVVFVSLGVLLLIISFLYQKYKNIVSDDTGE
ncbi:DUF2339 domain-containing protein [Robertkochia solimangrovi]|uniref:DUF2339 domain-containing protein n=1 Tax=Robertkochia solimangrovi TaxID=2213046 RepID=UPI00117FAE08|nr:DUF2339 domain-containing protein [Robertkochia solimangrovi]TRZ41178.1 DUF2339 domain-containing protein [Robertkochia solimangrovi]